MSGIKRFNHGVCEYPGGTFSEMNQESDGDYVLNSDHEAEIARLRAELQNAAKAALDAVALSCAKEREADALRAEVEGVRKDALQIAQTLARQCFGECRGFSDGLISTHEALAIAAKIQDAMGASA